MTRRRASTVVATIPVKGCTAAFDALDDDDFCMLAYEGAEREATFVKSFFALLWPSPTRDRNTHAPSERVHPGSLYPGISAGSWYLGNGTELKAPVLPAVCLAQTNL